MVSCSDPHPGFSSSYGRVRPLSESQPKMNDTTGFATETLQRIPGVYRRWELPAVLELNRRCDLEDAGAHDDGTPLVAVYVSVVGASSDIEP
jgi:hypothetical protein